MEGLLAEKDEFIDEVESDDLRDLDIIGVGIINERIEIILLDRLLLLANDLDLPAPIVDRLEQNQNEAEAALEKMQEYIEQRRTI
jgi:ferritin-like metal-binding protein YciE